ncbi:MAG TPA: hypothetical protein PK566_08825 [Pseudobacteroides sp.]|nr:hypothetical protein [Pseudobacteroides sp.]
MSKENPEFIDEKIIELLNKEQRKRVMELEKNNILTGIKTGMININGEDIEFHEKTLLDGKINIILPKSFSEMSPEIASIKYPSERRPKLIYTNESTSINISFNHTSTEVLDKNMYRFKDAMLQIVKKMQPAATWLEDGVEQINGRNIVYFDFLTDAIDGKIYNFTFIAELEGRALICSFNCTEEEMKQWKQVARGIMETLKVNTSIA